MLNFSPCPVYHPNLSSTKFQVLRKVTAQRVLAPGILSMPTSLQQLNQECNTLTLLLLGSYACFTEDEAVHAAPHTASPSRPREPKGYISHYSPLTAKFKSVSAEYVKTSKANMQRGNQIKLILSKDKLRMDALLLRLQVRNESALPGL